MRLSTAIGAALFLTSCVVGPDYVLPETETPDAWNELGGVRVSDEPADLARWWTAFGDATLDALVARATAANLDLAQAAARVREARAQARQVSGERYPELDAAGSATRQRLSENGTFAVPGDPQGNLYSAGFDASWELDVFGGTRRALEAAGAEVEASMADRRAVLVSLLGEVARAYVDLRGNQRLAEVARANAAAARDTLALTRTRQRAGLGNELDVARAETLLANAEAQLPQLEAAAQVAIHRLSVLLAEEPGALAGELAVAAPIPAPPERILVGLPSETLARRPDVRRAERQLAAASARIGVAEAERYPRFSLTGAFGLESANGSDFADAASRAWSLGPSVRWPLFAGGRIEADIEVQDARAEQALLAYRQSLLVALEEVEDALVGYLREWDHRRALEAAVLAAKKSVALADDLYARGLTSFLDVLDAQRALYDSELELAQSEASTALGVVALYKALGGGWESEG